MEVIINGKSEQVSDGISVSKLLEHLKIKPVAVAVELNLEIVPKSDYNKRTLKMGDKLEIISFVGGG